MSGSLVHLEPAAERPRRVYLIRWGGLEGPQRWRWACPAGCGFDVDEAGQGPAQVKADSHTCEAGWCALRAP